MHIRYFHVDAFTSAAFGGNPAGVCPLEQWLREDTLQRIAAENNLSETAFFTQDKAQGSDAFRLRWFTPVAEVDLCGHATLASAHVLFSELAYSAPTIRFSTRSGWLTVARRNDLIELDFPSRPPLPCAVPEELSRGLKGEPSTVLKSRDYLAVFDSQDQVAALEPDFGLLAQLDAMGIIVTAPGSECDFVSRFFAPKVGINEDPATGSSHCTLIPYWAERLGKTELFARQISKRRGEMACRLLGDRVAIGGRAVAYGRGTLVVPAADSEVAP